MIAGPLFLLSFISLASWCHGIPTLPETFVDHANEESDKINLRARLSPEEVAAIKHLADELLKLSSACKRHIQRCFINAPYVTRMVEYCYDITTMESCIKGLAHDKKPCSDQDYASVRSAACADVPETNDVAATVSDTEANNAFDRLRRQNNYESDDFVFNATYTNFKP